jgi:thiosulfate dehydrogenase
MITRQKIKVLTGSSFLLLLTAIALFSLVVLLQLKPALFDAYLVDAASWKPKDIRRDLPKGHEGKMVTYGHKLVSESAKWMGPMVNDPAFQYAGNNLSCTNCHLDNGMQPGAAAWTGISQRFPQFRGRENRIGTLEDRVNGCMERSMNGRKLPVNSIQMQAIIAYMDWMSEGVPDEIVASQKGFTKLVIPDFPADLNKGKLVYEKECQTCHGNNGAGVKKSAGAGYQFPPLWGEDAYNDGAGMNRVLTAAQFIKANMPFGQATRENPKLTDEEAYHVAAYINSFERPQKRNPEKDFPDLLLKPVSTPYGPWEDSFSAEQHKYGPFLPIINYYKENHGITKTK